MFGKKKEIVNHPQYQIGQKVYILDDLTNRPVRATIIGISEDGIELRNGDYSMRYFRKYTSDIFTSLMEAQVRLTTCSTEL